jgi:hypothetical protein
MKCFVKIETKHWKHIFVGSSCDEKIINRYCCVAPNQNFFPNFQSPNGHLLILDFSKVQNELNT